jgi:cytochrome c-type biogenesis protein CcmE
MTPRHQRMLLVAAMALGLALALYLALSAFNNNISYFFDPSKVMAGEAPVGRPFRLGGMVTKGSLQRAPGSLQVTFVLTDFAHSVTVHYSGLLPDLFREGQGVIAHGELRQGEFYADEVLAKHDERYMPPEVAKSLKLNPPAAEVVKP